MIIIIVIIIIIKTTAVVITKRHPLELQREMAVTILNRGFFDPSDTFSL